MIKDIQINNFRSINKADIEGFRRVNLLFGKNNCGKSTLLESIFLLTGQSNPLIPVLINVFRGYNKTDEKDLFINFHNLNINDPIIISSKEEVKRELNISLFKSYSNKVDIDTLKNNISNDRDGYYGIKMNYSLGEQAYHSEIIFQENQENQENQEKKQQAKVDKDKRYKEIIFCKYLPAKYNDNPAITGLREIIQNKKENLILEVLKIIEPTIKDIQIIRNDIFVGVDGLDRRMPINVMGDGIRKLLSILSSIYECRSTEERQGVLLIDEIDNGFHYSVMKKIWRAILNSAKRNNTQIFATTHNIDSIKGFNEAIKEENANEEAIAFALLHNKQSELKAYPYSQKAIEDAIEHNTEIR